MMVTLWLLRRWVIVADLDLERGTRLPIGDLCRAGDLNVDLRVVGTMQPIVESMQIRSSDDIVQMCRLE